MSEAINKLAALLEESPAFVREKASRPGPVRNALWLIMGKSPIRQ
jgi:hypothetical protein